MDFCNYVHSDQCDLHRTKDVHMKYSSPEKAIVLLKSLSVEINNM